jgi:hypothetical protein
MAYKIKRKRFKERKPRKEMGFFREMYEAEKLDDRINKIEDKRKYD